jgi:hypothetical protein
MFLEKKKRNRNLFWKTDENHYPISTQNDLVDKFMPFFVKVFRESRFIVEWKEHVCNYFFTFYCYLKLPYYYLIMLS